MDMIEEGRKALNSTMLDKVRMKRATPVIHSSLQEVLQKDPINYSPESIGRATLFAERLWEQTINGTADDMTVQEYCAGLNTYINMILTFGATSGEAVAISMTMLQQAYQIANIVLMQKAAEQVVDITTPGRKDN